MVTESLPRVLRVTTDEQGPLIVLLHGFAGSPEDLAPFASSMGVKARFVFPEGFVDLSNWGGSGRAWWPSDAAGREAARRTGKARDLSDFEPAGLQEAQHALSDLLDSLLAESPAPLVLGGFSQGAMLAVQLALCSARPLAGLVQLSGARIAQRSWNHRFASRSGMRAFISHGTADADLSFAAAEAFQAELRAAGWLVDFCPFEGGHEVPLLALRGLKRFLLSL